MRLISPPIPIREFLRAVAIACFAFSGGCSRGEASSETAWSYEVGPNGPVNWGKLTPDYWVCSAGLMQSPISLPKTDADSGAAIGDIQYSYVPAAAGTVSVWNTGHTVEVTFPEGSSVDIENTDFTGDSTFALTEVHFHHPSEHTIRGKPYPLEAHFVHKTFNGVVATIAVFFEESETPNKALEPIWAVMSGADAVTAGKVRLSEAFSVADLLPEAKSYIRYNGSLAEPPCTERVTWSVLLEPLPISKGQIDAFAALYKLNARPTQPLNGRATPLNSQ